MSLARFDVYQNPDASERSVTPYILDVQNTFLEVETRVVVPLHSPRSFTGGVRDLNPRLTVQGKQVVMNTSAIGAVPVSLLRRPVENLAHQQSDIQAALDTLLGGY